MTAELKPWEVVEFPWGTAVRHAKGRWQTVFISPSGQELDVSELNVELSASGIEFKEAEECLVRRN
jgi:hypothetical protein